MGGMMAMEREKLRNKRKRDYGRKKDDLSLTFTRIWVKLAATLGCLINGKLPRSAVQF